MRFRPSFFIVFVCHGDLCVVRPNSTENTLERSARPTAPRQGNASVDAHTHTVCLSFSLPLRYVFDVCAVAAPCLVQRGHCPLSTGHKQMWFWLWLGEEHSHGCVLHMRYTRVRIVVCLIVFAGARYACVTVVLVSFGYRFLLTLFYRFRSAVWGGLKTIKQTFEICPGKTI